MGVSFDEDQGTTTKRTASKTSGLAQLLITSGLASSEKEATQRLLVIAIALFVVTIMLFIGGAASSVDTYPIDSTDPALFDQTL